MGKQKRQPNVSHSGMHKTSHHKRHMQKHKETQRQSHKRHHKDLREKGQQRKPTPDVRPAKHNKGQHINRWDEANMEMAVQEFKRGLRQLARAWNVPKSTLQRRVKGIVNGTDHASGRKRVFAGGRGRTEFTSENLG